MTKLPCKVPTNQVLLYLGLEIQHFDCRGGGAGVTNTQFITDPKDIWIFFSP